ARLHADRRIVRNRRAITRGFRVLLRVPQAWATGTSAFRPRDHDHLALGARLLRTSGGGGGGRTRGLRFALAPAILGGNGVLGARGGRRQRPALARDLRVRARTGRARSRQLRRSHEPSARRRAPSGNREALRRRLAALARAQGLATRRVAIRAGRAAGGAE